MDSEIKIVDANSVIPENGFLSVLTCIFEFSSSVLSILRSIQAVRPLGPWGQQRQRLFYLLAEQGWFILIFPEYTPP
jgi:hypothetical protein